jgi:hypothetical protein
MGVGLADLMLRSAFDPKRTGDLDVNRMNNRIVGLLLVLLACTCAAAGAEVGMVPRREIAIGGVTVGETPAQVRKKLGQPLRELEDSDYLDLHYDYPSVRVSFNDGVVAGLRSRSPEGCTPRMLCVGDSVERMRSLYGRPLVADRETGRYYEYYGAEDVYCWLQITADDVVRDMTVQCQP